MTTWLGVLGDSQQRNYLASDGTPQSASGTWSQAGAAVGDVWDPTTKRIVLPRTAASPRGVRTVDREFALIAQNQYLTSAVTLHAAAARGGVGYLLWSGSAGTPVVDRIAVSDLSVLSSTGVSSTLLSGSLPSRMAALDDGRLVVVAKDGNSVRVLDPVAGTETASVAFNTGDRSRPFDLCATLDGGFAATRKSLASGYTHVEFYDSALTLTATVRLALPPETLVGSTAVPLPSVAADPADPATFYVYDVNLFNGHSYLWVLSSSATTDVPYAWTRTSALAGPIVAYPDPHQVAVVRGLRQRQRERSTLRQRQRISAARQRQASS